MPTIENHGRSVEVDDAGFFEHIDDWNEEVACALAKHQGQTCPLTAKQMDILLYMRDYFAKFNSFPVPRALCKNVRQGKNCIYEQFPNPIVAWRIAGLPSPTTEVLAAIKRGI